MLWRSRIKAGWGRGLLCVDGAGLLCFNPSLPILRSPPRISFRSRTEQVLLKFAFCLSLIDSSFCLLICLFLIDSSFLLFFSSSLSPFNSAQPKSLLCGQRRDPLHPALGTGSPGRRAAWEALGHHLEETPQSSCVFLCIKLYFAFRHYRRGVAFSA